MADREDMLDALMQVIGVEGCGVACEDATVFKDDLKEESYADCSSRVEFRVRCQVKHRYKFHESA